MNKKVIVFDLDETLTETRSPITDEMSELLAKLLNTYQVCVISGGSIEQFKKQFLDHIKIDTNKLANLHLMPTCGTRYYAFDISKNNWVEVYAENFKEKDKKIIAEALDAGLNESGYRIQNPKGPLVEDRGSQVTLSTLGQDAGPPEKKAWDPTGEKKLKIRDIVAKKIPQFEVRVGGTTSVDVTKQGIDKAYGMKKLMGILKIRKDEILFIGDRIFEGGNDYPVKLMGIDTIAVNGFEHTPQVVRDFLTKNI